MPSSRKVKGISRMKRRPLVKFMMENKAKDFFEANKAHTYCAHFQKGFEDQVFKGMCKKCAQTPEGIMLISSKNIYLPPGVRLEMNFT